MNSDSSSPLHRLDPAAVEAARERLKAFLSDFKTYDLGTFEGRVEFNGDLSFVLAALSARDEAREAQPRPQAERWIFGGSNSDCLLCDLNIGSFAFLDEEGSGSICIPCAAALGWNWRLEQAESDADALARQLSQEQPLSTSSSSKEEGQG